MLLELKEGITSAAEWREDERPKARLGRRAGPQSARHTDLNPSAMTIGFILGNYVIKYV